MCECLDFFFFVGIRRGGQGKDRCYACVSRWIARLLEALPHRMLGSHLTLNRSLATYILLVRLQPRPPPPPHLVVRSWLFDFDMTLGLSFLFSHVLRRPWSS